MAFPLAIRYPKLIRPGTRLDAMAANFDIGLTLLELCGTSYPAEYARRLPGSSLVPLLKGGSTALRKAHYYRFFQHHMAVPGHVASRVVTLR